MTCTTRYAEAWDYGAFFCLGNLFTGFHEGVGPADAALSVAQGNFIQNGFRPNIGQILYNLTQSTNGPITNVTDTTLTATGVTWANGDQYRASTMDGAELLTAEHYLDITAVDITIALQSVGAHRNDVHRFLSLCHLPCLEA